MTSAANRRRWSDNDHNFGPFTYARDHRGYRPLAIVLNSGDGDESPVCTLRFSGFGHTLITALPALIKPWRHWVDTSRYEWSRGPDSGYWDAGPREYGFTYSDGHLSVSLGRVTNDSSTEQRWGCFLPWTQWRHVRHSLYGLNGELVGTIPQRSWRGLSSEGVLARHRDEESVRDACPTADFAFHDFDGELLAATTRIEEREWRFGEGWFKWLSLFRRPKIQRSLDIQFSGETGERKGSWKGGTIGHSIDMLTGELHEAAFRRYCGENDMTFIAALSAKVK